MLSSLEKLVEQFSKLIGLNPKISNLILFLIALLVFIISVVKAFIKIISFIRYWLKQNIIDRDIFPFFTRGDIQHATKYYIETRYQNISPTEDDEPGSQYIASAKDQLLPLFLDKVFKYGKSDNKYFLILADSGMGKTTFLINLYLKYKLKNWRNISLRKFKIRLVPIWHQKAFEYIEQIPEKENTILLLDAFDEMIEAQQNHFLALKKLLDKTYSFRQIILTCRTQFFPSKEEEPNETGYFTAGERGEYHFQKAYLSVFDDHDVKKYLRKKYPFVWHRSKRIAGTRVCQKSASLIIRPMLLNYIDDILKDEQQFKYSFQIYHSLINSWMKRESLKRSIKEKYKSEFRFYRALKEFSEKIALNMYHNRIRRNGYYIPIEEEFGFDMLTIEEVAVGLDENIILSELDAKSKSLLNRNSTGDYKFSHKSVLEYYLSESIFSGQLDYKSFDFSGMDMARKFLTEMIVNKLSKEMGTFHSIVSGSSVREYKLNLLQSKQVDNVEQLTIGGSISFNPLFLDVFKNLKILKLNDETYFKLIYEIYWIMYCFFDSIFIQVNEQVFPTNKKHIYDNFLQNLNKLGFNHISVHMRSMSFKILSEVISNSKIVQMDFTKKNIESFFEELTSSEIEKLKNIETFFESTFRLSEKLPACKVLY